MGKQVRLVHSVSRSALASVLEHGLKAVHDYSCVDLEMRKNVVCCWLRKEDDRLRREDRTYVEVTVEEGRCLVADMDIISLAMMYEPGSGSDAPAIPVRKNAEAARLLAEVYRITAVPLAEYREGMFGSPEVLVSGDIGPEYIRLME